MRTAYHELQVFCRERESLENSTRAKMESELGRLLKSGKELQGKKKKKNLKEWRRVDDERIFCSRYKQFQMLKHPLRSREFILTLN